MIDSIHGIIEKKEPTNLFIKLNGFVFNISICIRDYEKLPSVGKKIDVLTYLNVRENLMELYGFLSKDRRDLFIQLISVSGIGPRTAINLLSNVSVQNFKENIITEDIKSLSLIPGIGPKTAKRIIVELKDKFISSDSNDLPIDEEIETNSDVFSVLKNLGYKSKDIRFALNKVDNKGNLEDKIKQALKELR